MTISDTSKVKGKAVNVNTIQVKSLKMKTVIFMVMETTVTLQWNGLQNCNRKADYSENKGISNCIEI